MRFQSVPHQVPFRHAAFVLVVLMSQLLLPPSLMANTFEGEEYVLATVNPIATDAGVQVFRNGGNAIDAAVAALLTLSVVDGHNSGIGGGCLILIHTADGRLVAIDGREMAPAAATPDMCVVDGKLNPELSQTGSLASGVPGALAAYDKAIDLCGTRPLSELLAPAIDAAENGFVINSSLGHALVGNKEKIGRFDGTRQVYFKDNGQVHREGDRLVQPDLARTLKHVAAEGVEWFYQGEYASKVDQWMKANGGLMTKADLGNYEAVVREPIVSHYRGYKIIGFPPPSSGGVHVAQALNMLENYDLGGIAKKDPIEALHLTAEVFSRAFADRAYWLGDADFVSVPKGLTDEDYAKQLATTIDMQKATEVPTHGTPPQWKQDIFGRHTTHVAAADSKGNWVAITATVNTSFGSGVIVPGTGVVLNNEMDDFSIQPGVPNAFKLVGAENNAIAPGKRPLSSMSPTIVLDDKDQPVLTIGAAGGPKIITQVIQGIIRFIDYGQSVDEAVASPRIHHQWRPNQLGVEERAPRQWADALADRGHSVRTLPSAGVTQAIARQPNGKLVGVSDPRIPGKTSGK